MMARPLSLECFDRQSEADTRKQQLLAEEEWLTVFERGYKDGWDDASKSNAEGQSQIQVDLARTLEDIAFTHAQARAEVIKQLKPVMTAVLEHLLKPALNDTLIAQILEEIASVEAMQTDRPVEIAVAPENLTKLQVMTKAQAHLAARFVADPTIGSGQAFLRMGETEQNIDLQQAMRDIATIVEDFFETPVQEEEHAHG